MANTNRRPVFGLVSKHLKKILIFALLLGLAVLVAPTVVSYAKPVIYWVGNLFSSSEPDKRIVRHPMKTTYPVVNWNGWKGQLQVPYHGGYFINLSDKEWSGLINGGTRYRGCASFLITNVPVQVLFYDDENPVDNPAFTDVNFGAREPLYRLKASEMKTVDGKPPQAFVYLGNISDDLGDLHNLFRYMQ
jgi:hypothetical protein